MQIRIWFLLLIIFVSGYFNIGSNAAPAEGNGEIVDLYHNFKFHVCMASCAWLHWLTSAFYHVNSSRGSVMHPPPKDYFGLKITVQFFSFENQQSPVYVVNCHFLRCPERD